MENNEIYQSLNDNEGLKLPSYMGIIPNDKNFVFDKDKMKKALEANKNFKLISFEKPDEDKISEDAAEFCFEAVIEYDEEEFTVLIAKQPTEDLDLHAYSFANTIAEESLEQATQSPHYLDVSTLFCDNPMISFLFQLKVLHTLVPDSGLVIDFSSLRLLSPHWLKMSAETSIPPSPNYLYIIHAVYDEKENGDTQYWMHTHGLHRCGSMELELVNIKNGAQQMHNLINTAANLFIMEHHKENESFRVGYDGLGINICWLRWEEALSEFPEDVLGGRRDREEEDGSYNVHSEPSGILFAVEESNLISPEIYASTLADNPIFFIRNDETLRMSALAKERFQMFKDTFDKYGVKEEEKKSFLGKLFGKKKEEESEWRFLVKLGLTTDDAKEATDKEHLWYEVQSVEGETVTGKLLNQPYWIAGLNEGDVKSYPIKEVLTDWVIYGPEAEYTPDSIYMLYN